MRQIVQVLRLGAALVAVSACGSNNIAISGGETSPLIARLGMTPGNWYLLATSQITRGRVTNFSGPVTLSSSAISLTTTPSLAACFPVSSPVVFSGVAKGDDVTLTSPPVTANSRVMTVTGSALYGTNLEGTYQVTSGQLIDPCNGDVGTVRGTLVPSLSGLWSGSLVESASDVNGQPILDALQRPLANTAVLAASITQADVPVTLKTAGGTLVSAFPLSGTVTFTNSGCYQSASIDSTQSGITGALYQLVMKTNTGDTIISSGSLDPTRATAIGLVYTVPSGACKYYLVNGTLTNP